MSKPVGEQAQLTHKFSASPPNAGSQCQFCDLPRRDHRHGAGEYDEKKRCCTVCDAKARCSVCSAQTQYACADCRMDFRVTIYVCGKCRAEHEEKCSARLREVISANQRKIEVAANAIRFTLTTPGLIKGRDQLVAALAAIEGDSK